MPADTSPKIVVLDSATKLKPEHAGCVAVAASHGGVYAAHLAALVRVRGVILNDAGLGLDRAGIGGLAHLDGLGIAAATAGHMTARIGDGADMMANGIVSHVNQTAQRLGCAPGQKVADCAALMRTGTAPADAPPKLAESRIVLRDEEGLPRVLGLDSVSLLRPEDDGAIVISASHGAMLAGQPDGSVRQKLRAITFHDAGIGKDGAGTTRLPVLDAAGIPAVTIAADSARIGDARSLYETGVVSRANALAAALGVRPGDSTARFVELMTAAPAEPEPDEVLDLYQRMHMIRNFEHQAMAALSRGDAYGPLHSCEGQEATAVGVCAALEQRDRILSTHRGHGHAIAKGAAVEGMMAEIFGRETGTCGGKGGSMHIADFAVGMLGANGVVAANINIAAGVAQALKMQGSDAVTVCFIGDGAVNRGPFLEGLNWARIYNLRVLFACEDNGYSAFTATAPMTGGEGIAARARSLGLEVTEVDGMDLVTVTRAARRLVAAMRADPGPRLLLARTQRLSGHTVLDAAAYRPSGEAEANRALDPLPRCAAWLERQGVGANRIAAAEAQAAETVAAAVEAAKSAPWPAPTQIYADVQDIGSPAERAF